MIWLNRLFRLFQILICVAFFAYVFLISLRNHAKIDLDLYFYQVQQAPVEVVVVSAFLLGGVLGVLSWILPSLSGALKHKRSLNKAKKELI